MNMIRIQSNLIAAALMAAISISSLAGTLSQLPLSLKSGVPPNIMFALSVEFPTAITPAYQDASSYSRNNTYLGYFDDQKCYAYNSALTSGSVSGWFYPIAYSTTVSSSPHACVSGWSGNFLNWVSMAGLDEFRFAMTGGNRVVDLPNSTTNPGGLTVLERSYQSNQGGNFINKAYTEDGVTTGYAAGVALTIVNKGNGVTMVVTPSNATTATATCLGPQLLSGGGFNCGGTGSSIGYGYSLSSGDAVSCATYIGNGTSTSPYQCSVFQTDSAGVPVTSPSAMTSSVLTASSVAGSVNISCPAGSFSAKPPSCTAALSNGTTGSCNSWIGSGTASSPYICSGFGLFSGGAGFATTMPLSAPNVGGLASTPGTSSTPYLNNNVTCSVSGTTPTTTCTSLDNNGTTSTCSSYTAISYGGNTYYQCSSFTPSSPSTDTYVSNSPASYSYTTVSKKKYLTNYNITNNINSPITVYYDATNTGTYGAPIYYYSSYNVTLGSGTTTYNVRAKVCDPTVGVESDCQQYSDNATWKPTGVLQGNSISMRFGVTSYFMNSGGVANSGGGISDIDNAVLRSKAKYLGPQQLLLAGGFGPNAAAEWSATDGTFINNPDSGDTATMTTPWGVAPANSGVINYINKFGSTAKYYKTYDDIGKLYYETLKYLRGGNYNGTTATGTPAPTTAFYNGAKSATSDGFPVITTWDDPVKYSCQKNYIITMGDAHTWCDKRLPGGTYTTTGSSVCNAYTDGNNNAHPNDLGSLSGDTGILGKINGTTISAATGTADATNAVGAMEGMGGIAQSMTGAGGASFYMAGLAAWAATNNIRPDLAPNSSPMTVKTFVIDVQEDKDCAYQKQFWLTAKYGDPTNYDASGLWSSTAAWYNSLLGNSFPCNTGYSSPPNYGSSTAYMNWPKNLLRAGDPISMIASVKSAIQSIAAAQGDEAALAQSAGTLNTGTGAYIYQAGYNSGGWTGDVQAFVISQSGTFNTTANWTASQMLPNPSVRNIVSFNRTSYAGIQFAPDSSNGLSNFDSYQQGLLNTSDLGVVDGFGVDRVTYIRGDMTKEAYLPSATGAASPNTQANHLWRSRRAEGLACSSGCPTLASYTAGPTGQLGDVIFSNPLYVSAPSAAFPDASYKYFAQVEASRTPMIYVGGNDGMLHAYNAAYYIDPTTNLPSSCPQMSGSTPASTQPANCKAGLSTSYSGTEVFGYVPYASYSSLSMLMSPNYAHRYYVDGSPVTSDVCIRNGSGSAYCDGTNDTWMTMLVGGLNAGGKGIYALNITDPVTGFGSSNVLWEFTDKDDPDLGYTFSQPIIRKLNNKRFAVIFGNGFNSVDATGNPNNNNAYLYILYVDPNLSTTQPWTLGTNYFKITLTSPGTPNNASNGLASVTAIDINQDGMIDYVYGGDRNGNMWKIDLTSISPTSWGPAFSGSPLFSAVDGAGHRQQITTAPTAARNPNGGFMVMFGTGSWIDQADVNPQSGTLFYTDTLYGIWDMGAPVAGRSALQRQAIIGTYSVDSNGNSCTPGTGNCTTYTIQSSCDPNFSPTPLATSNATNLCPATVPNVTPATQLASLSGTPQQFGWFFDLPGNGERSHSDPPVLTGSVIQFTTLTPATNPCTGNTSGFEYNLSYLTGGAVPAGLFLIPGNPSGYVSFIPPGSTVAIQVPASGKSLVGGAALNPVSFDIPPSAAGAAAAGIAPPAGLPTQQPNPCTAGNCNAANYFVPGWGFLNNLARTSSALVQSCYPSEMGGGLNCDIRHKLGKFGRLSWKQF
ncbi:PilC/PilY family type IV pilus protein [Sideroxydans sp. CL21]|uniref:pilus assembly protein n=1 Tax=Sideroxydans sp. CL21 TaxID=2600596 RepID=UPI0024BC71C9|nr:PilC/PilY family type IV pilus protein [Sideroxydans sp. CL21]